MTSSETKKRQKKRDYEPYIIHNSEETTHNQSVNFAQMKTCSAQLQLQWPPLPFWQCLFIHVHSSHYDIMCAFTSFMPRLHSDKTPTAAAAKEQTQDACKRFTEITILKQFFWKRKKPQDYVSIPRATMRGAIKPPYLDTSPQLHWGATITSNGSFTQ